MRARAMLPCVTSLLLTPRASLARRRMKGSSFNASFDGVLGSCRHELFQLVLGTTGDIRAATSAEVMDGFATTVARQHSEEIVGHDITEEQLKVKVLEIVPYIREFVDTYWGAVDAESMAKYNGRDSVKLKVLSIDAVEEEVS